MVEIRTTAKDGFNVATLNNNFIILNTELTKELILEGIAREMVSKVQNLRKEKDFNIVDRITLYYSADAEVVEAIKEFEEFIKNETLAVSLVNAENLDTTYDINGHEVYIDIKR